MKILQELVSFNRMPDDREEDISDVEFDATALDDDEMSDEDPQELDFDAEPSFDDLPDDENDINDLDFPEDEDLDQEPTEPEDPNRQGLIRTVKKAHLVYKRQTEEGTYEELWMYNTTSLRDEMAIRKSILSGTDIPVNRTSSPDGEQEYETWTAGNAEMMLIRGLPQ